MTQIKIFSLVGAMLMSTVGASMAQSPICCPTSVPEGACVTAGSVTGCYLKCTGETCTAGKPTDYTWSVLQVSSPTPLSGVTPEVLGGSMLICKYSTPAGATASYNTPPSGCSVAEGICAGGESG